MHDNCTQVAVTLHDLWGQNPASNPKEFLKEQVLDTFPMDRGDIPNIEVQGFEPVEVVDRNIIINVDWSWK